MLHTFWLLETGEWSYHLQQDDIFLPNHSTKITISDDIIWYLSDSLQWVETSNPANNSNWNGSGLNMYGPTIITTTGAVQFARILTAWAILLANGPLILQLTGGWVYDVDEKGKKNDGKYDTILVGRDELVTTLQRLVEYANEAQDRGKYILHFGL